MFLPHMVIGDGSLIPSTKSANASWMPYNTPGHHVFPILYECLVQGIVGADGQKWFQAVIPDVCEG
jgi:hypothetical protein